MPGLLDPKTQGLFQPGLLSLSSAQSFKYSWELAVAGLVQPSARLSLCCTLLSLW